MSDIARLVPRLSTTERLILDLLREGELFGLQLVDRSDGALKRGTVYVTLGRMEKKRLITSRLEAPPPDAGGMPRRLYSPTLDGRRVLAAWNELAKVMGRLNPEFAR